jgi:hypothetical protein
LIDGVSSSYAGGVKDRELRALEERLEGVNQRLSSVEQGQGLGGQGTSELLSSVGELSQLVRRQHRLLSLNSFAAYLLFTVLLCAAFYFLYTDRAGDAEAERDTALAARDAAQARAEGTARQLAAREAADRASASVLDLLRQRRYREAIAAHRDLAGTELGPAQRQFLADAVAGARSQLVADAALRARQAFDRRDYQRGHDLAKDGLALTAAGGPGLEGPASAELRYVLAAALDKLGRAAEARDAYAAFLTAAPDHEMAVRARQRLARLERAL